MLPGLKNMGVLLMGAALATVPACTARSPEPLALNQSSADSSQIVLTPTSGGSITDASGNVWTLTASGDIEENGSPVPGGGGTSALTYVAATQTIWGSGCDLGGLVFLEWQLLGSVRRTRARCRVRPAAAWKQQRNKRR